LLALLDDQKWDKAFIKADKYSGSLRYTISREQFEEGKFPHLIDGIVKIEVMPTKP